MLLLSLVLLLHLLLNAVIISAAYKEAGTRLYDLVSVYRNTNLLVLANKNIDIFLLLHAFEKIILAVRIAIAVVVSVSGFVTSTSTVLDAMLSMLLLLLLSL